MGVGRTNARRCRALPLTGSAPVPSYRKVGALAAWPSQEKHETMTPASKDAIKVPTFSAHLESRDGAVFVWMKGNADMAVHERVKDFLAHVARTARSSGAQETVFEMAELYFMNSSCQSLLLRFINGVVALRASDRYRVRFRSNPHLRWQKKSLAALHSFAPEIVIVE
jgi:hypothetical protein